MLLADCRAKRANYRGLPGAFVAKGLNRPAVLNPAFNIRDTASQAELDQIAQVVTVSGGFAAYARRRPRIRPRVNKLSHYGEK